MSATQKVTQRLGENERKVMALDLAKLS